jgi:hypothetical protein
MLEVMWEYNESVHDSVRREVFYRVVTEFVISGNV